MTKKTFKYKRFYGCAAISVCTDDQQHSCIAADRAKDQQDQKYRGASNCGDKVIAYAAADTNDDRPEHIGSIA